MEEKKEIGRDRVNKEEQKLQIEVLWNAMKILRQEAYWHATNHDDLGHQLEDPEWFSVKSGRALAAWDFVYELLRQRLRLLERDLLHQGDQFGEPDVGALAELAACASERANDLFVGPYFTFERAAAFLENSQKCDGTRWPCSHPAPEAKPKDKPKGTIQKKLARLRRKGSSASKRGNQ
jgi:hypothetical protein